MYRNHRIRLFCIADHGPRPGAALTHEFTAEEAEQIIYTLQAMYASAVCQPDDGEKELLGTDAYLMQQPCLRTILEWAGEPEMYAEWVGEMVAARFKDVPAVKALLGEMKERQQHEG